MTATASRLAQLASRYDLVIIGGGITGAGVLREAVRTGASVLLVDKQDFAAGTSGGSSKLVHGGLRYLQSGQWRLTLESVRERGRLLRDAAGLVEPQRFLMPVHRGRKPSRAMLRAGLWIYDLMAGRRGSRWIPATALLELEPTLDRASLLGAMSFEDAQTDDARLVQRLIEDSRQAGARALNYVEAQDLIREGERVTGLELRDRVTDEVRSIETGLIVNATGVWARQFAAATGGAPVLRPLRGSHFMFPLAALPIAHAISWLHPRDRRPVFAYPWEGAVLVGTTDLDHDVRALDTPRMTPEESAYLIEALQQRFPSLALEARHALCSFAGVRPVIAGGQAAPSAESRESALWSRPGLVSITGGKLTTFRLTARAVLHEAARQQPALAPRPEASLFKAPSIHDPAHRRLTGRFGPKAASGILAEGQDAALLEPLGGTPYTRAELMWSARHEQVVHLEDLMLRRSRLGLVAPHGATEWLPSIRDTVQSALGWDDARWTAEATAYESLWQQRYAPL